MRLVYPLTTDRLIIRALTPDDVERHHALFSDPDVVRYLYFGRSIARRAGSSRASKHRRVAGEGGWINFGVEAKGEGVLIGELAMGFISSTTRTLKLATCSTRPTPVSDTPPKVQR